MGLSRDVLSIIYTQCIPDIKCPGIQAMEIVQDILSIFRDTRHLPAVQVLDMVLQQYCTSAIIVLLLMGILWVHKDAIGCIVLILWTCVH